MKKILIFSITLVILATCLISCGNMSMSYGNFTFTHIHFSDQIEGHCLDFDQWIDYKSGVEIYTLSGYSIFIPDGTYQMFECKAACPYCN